MPGAQPARTPLILATALLVAFAVSWPAIFWRGGVLELEATSFVTAYSAERPLLAKIFDPRINDFGNYQARELSYLVDSLDAAVYRFLVFTFHLPFFVPLSTLVCSALLVLVFMTGARRIAGRVDPLTAALWMACLLSSFQFVFTMGLFYRSSKPALAVALLALLFQVTDALRQHAPSSAGANATSEVRPGLSTFALALICGLFDRQGFYYVIIVCLFLAAHYLATRRGRGLVAGACSAFLVLVLYNLVVAPALILSLNGYLPDFSMQSIALGRGSLVAHPWLVVQAYQLLCENTGVLFGGIRLAGFVVVPIFLVATAMAFRRGGSQLRRCSFLAFGFQLLMFALMIQKLSQLYDWIDHRYWYYPLPFLVTILFFGVLGLDALLPRVSGRQRWLLRAAFLVIAVCNLWSLRAYRELVAGGPWFGEIYPQSERLKLSLKNGAPDPALDKDYRAFYDFTRRVEGGD